MATKLTIEKLVTVFGGSGFLGRHVVRALAGRGYRIRVAVRRPGLAGYLQPMGRVGQIHAVQANLRYPDSVAAAVRDADAVVNLVGLMLQSGGQRFDAIMADGAETVAKAASAVGAPLVHVSSLAVSSLAVSSLAADPNAGSHYARAKREGEQRVRAAQNEAIIVRPSIIFGPEDDFFNRFGAMTRLAPALPLVGGGHTRMQPVFAGDVAEGVAKAVDGSLQPAAIYEFGGPSVYTFRELMQFVLSTVERRRLLLPVPFGLMKLQASVLQFLPKPPITPDQVDLLKSDNVVTDEAKRDGRTLEGIGIIPDSIEAIVPSYLWRFRKTGQFQPHAAH